ncbi:MAG TPA: stage II sporulation protein P [Bacillota bacterium]|nr:stage II sporulation protein P [Bacillota bacterium]
MERSRAFLRAGLPLLALEPPDANGPAIPVIAWWLHGVVNVVTGVDLADRRSLLHAQIPLFGQVELPVQLPATSPREDEEEPAPVILPPAPVVPPPARNETIRVAVYHTHATEAFLPTMFASTAGRRPQEAFSADPEVGVLRVGEELVRVLRDVHGIGAVQDRTMYDQAGRLSSYERSAVGAARLLREHPGLELVLDVHRDEGRRSLTTIEVGGKPAARVLLVVGTDRRLPHPHWRKNYAVARRLAALMEETHPGLSRGVRVKDWRYNQHVFDRLLLVEIGAHENELEDALHTAYLLAAIVAGMLEGGPAAP